MDKNQAAGVLAVALCVGLIIMILIKSPLRKIAKLVANSALGFIVMAALNYAGVRIVINWISVVITAIFGIPGICVVYFLQKIF